MPYRDPQAKAQELVDLYGPDEARRLACAMFMSLPPTSEHFPHWYDVVVLLGGIGTYRPRDIELETREAFIRSLYGVD
jgi:hypothetical protein